MSSQDLNRMGHAGRDRPRAMMRIDSSGEWVECETIIQPDAKIVAASQLKIEDINDLAECWPEAWDVLCRHYGRSFESVRGMAEAGELGCEAIDALTLAALTLADASMTDATDRFMPRRSALKRAAEWPT